MDEKREVTQFQYHAWPDHGLPLSPDGFLDLALKTDEANKNSAPIVVHCRFVIILILNFKFFIDLFFL